MLKITIKNDAGKILLFIYDSYANDKDSVSPEKLLEVTKWDGNKIDRAIQYLKDIDAIDITFILGDVNGLRNFLFEKVTPIGTGMIENKRKFKKNFGFEVNIGLNPSVKLSWGASEK